jgi:hypothetical protein
MTKRILYFVETTMATEEEVAEIEKLNETRFIVNVLNASEDIRYGVGRRIPCDFVAGTVPESYGDIPVFDIGSLPELPEPTPPIQDGQIIHVRNYGGTDSHQGTAVVAEDETLTGVNLGNTTAMVDGSDKLAVEGGGEVSFTITGGAITNTVYTPAADGLSLLVRNGDTITLKNGKNVKLKIAHSKITDIVQCP